jgi:hypothetical protein
MLKLNQAIMDSYSKVLCESEDYAQPSEAPSEDTGSDESVIAKVQRALRNDESFADDIEGAFYSYYKKVQGSVSFKDYLNAFGEVMSELKEPEEAPEAPEEAPFSDEGSEEA